MAGYLENAQGRANTVVQVQAGMQVQPVVLVTSTGSFVNAGTATTIPPGVANTGGQPNAVVVPQAGTQIRAVCILDSSGAYVFA
jgi:hypothetical protein